ncbi:transposase [Luteibacter sp. UNC138MFCol5.1]|uniref:REP-associated tyrosine transposase n=1 Tax=Luteibacter sp. UNC138MFCol5.1 TaxID=1502774 RepID=UPI002100B538|nr:transposase [Luteibacter sp. UNC138MFCol5.1]
MIAGMIIQPGQAALRIGRTSEPGRIYLVTTCTWNRAPLFRNHRAARAACRTIHSERSWRDASCIAWVLMPDHWHGLIHLRESELSKVVEAMKSRVTKALRAEGRVSPVWQRAFHDRAIREDDDVKAAARYVIANPVRAGLVARVGDYPYWNTVWI